MGVFRLESMKESGLYVNTAVMLLGVCPGCLNSPANLGLHVKKIPCLRCCAAQNLVARTVLSRVLLVSRCIFIW